MAKKWRDAAWKEIIITCLDEALEFFMPDLALERDFEREVTLPGGELPPISGDSDARIRIPDVVASIPTKGGGERSVVIVVEQQHEYDADLPIRMFETFYRISDRMRLPVTSLVIFTGNIREENRYEYSCFGTEVAFKYNSYSVAKADVRALRSDGRVFAVVVLAAKLMLESGGDPKKRGDYACELLRLMRERNYDYRTAKNVLEFIGRALRLRDDDIDTGVKEEWNMYEVPISEAVKEIEIRWAIEEGMEKGMQKGEYGKAVDIAKKMLARGMEPDVVADLSGLSEGEVMSLRD